MGALAASLISASCTTQRQKPNILLIVADDLGWNDVGFHGSEIATPHLDKLANQGMELTRFYACPICSPTRAGLLTGNYPDRMNLRNYVFSPSRLGGIPQEETTIPEMLEKAGYKHRAAFGKWHLGHSHIQYHPNNQGFSYFYGHYNGAIDYYSHLRNGELDWHRNNEPCFDEGYSTDLIGKEAVNFIKASAKEAPFFAYVAFNAPHSPMQANMEELYDYGFDPQKGTDGYPIVQGHNGERGMDVYGLKGRGNTLHQTYAAMVSRMDHWIGEIQNTLEAEGIADNTIIWFLSDNGGLPSFGGNNEPLRGGKHSTWEGGVRTVSVVKWPGKTKPGSTSNEMIAYIDVFATVEKLVTGENSPKDGIDVSEAFMGNSLPERSLFLGHQAIATKKWKLNNNQLFDIEKDISETKDVSKEHSEVIRQLKAELESFKKMTPEIGLPKHPNNWLPPKNWTMSDTKE